MPWLRRIGVSLAVFVLAAAALEAALWVRGDPPFQVKKWFRTHRTWGNCYATDAAGVFPLDIARSPADRATLEAQILKGKKPDGSARVTVSELVEVAPHCIIYDDRRTQGLHPGRPDRIVIVGDSFAFGEGLPPEHTLGYLLGERFRNANFANHSLCGADIEHHHKTAIAVMGTPQRFKRVLMVITPNDLPGASEVAGVRGQLQLRLDPARRPARPGPLAALMLRTRTARLVDRVLERHREAERLLGGVVRPYVAPQHAPTRRRAARMLQEVQLAARERKARLLVLLYPFLYKDLRGRYPLRPAHRFWMSVCRRHGIRCIDGQKAFGDAYAMRRFQVNPVDSHPNRAANLRVVDLLARRAADFFAPTILSNK